MKKIIIGIFSFAMLLMAQNASAAVWNGASNDCRTIAIANYTANVGIIDPCWPLSSVSANPGDSINVRIYYHNTSSLPATNVRVVLNAPTGASSSHSFSGQIISDQGSLSFGPVSVNLPVSQKLIFGSTRWYQNQTQTHTGFLYGQTGSELVNSGGLNIGTIAPGWSSQGSVVVSFYVEKPLPTGSITAASPTCFIPAGASTCFIPFSWNTNNPIGTSSVTKDGVSGNYKTGNTGTNVSFAIPWGSSTFRLYNNSIELDTESVSASCVEGANWDSSTTTCKLPVHDCEIINFTAVPQSSAPGDPVVLTWNTNYCKSVSISSIGSNLSPNGVKTVWPTSTITYLLTAFGDTFVSPTKSVQVIVGGPVGAPGFPAGAPGYGA